MYSLELEIERIYYYLHDFLNKEPRKEKKIDTLERFGDHQKIELLVDL